MDTYECAPPSLSIKVISTFIAIIPLAILFMFFMLLITNPASLRTGENALLLVISILPTILIIGTAYWLCWRLKPVGYRFENGQIIISRRLPWREVRYSLSDLVSVEVIPRMRMMTIQMPGTGGLFSYTGRFYNTQMGWFRGYLTTSRDFILLRGTNNSIAISPLHVEVFLADLHRIIGR